MSSAKKLPPLSSTAATAIIRHCSKSPAENVKTVRQWQAYAREQGMRSRKPEVAVARYLRQNGGDCAYIHWADDRVTRCQYLQGGLYTSTAQA